MSVIVERGLVVAGHLLPGTDWCFRDPEAWWKSGERGTRPRAKVRDLLCGHWTAGEATIARYDDDGPFVVRGMRARLNPKTKAPLKVGIEFVIGACSPTDRFAPVWQTADLGATATVHVGIGAANARAVGVEVVNRGLAAAASTPHARPRDTVLRRVRGRRIYCAAFLPGQLRSWVRLAEALSDPESDLLLATGIQIPRAIPTTTAGTLLSDVRALTPSELARYAGAVEHALMPGTTKVDAGGMLLAELGRAGWVRRPLGV